jgi:hypothetical protein
MERAAAVCLAKKQPREARQNLCFLARERARERERKRTRNKNLKFFGYVHVYEHEHVHVVISKVRLWGRFCRASSRQLPQHRNVSSLQLIAVHRCSKQRVVVVFRENVLVP